MHTNCWRSAMRWTLRMALLPLPENTRLCSTKWGRKRFRAYREDLIATGKYNPMPTPRIRSAISISPSAISESQPVQAVSWMRTTLRWSVFRKTRFPAEADFGVRVSGNSMEPVYHDGQIVWVERCETLSIGQVGVFVYDGEGYLKSYGGAGA